MTTKFVRGARVKSEPASQPSSLSMIECAMVTVDVARRDGYDEAQFVEYMRRAWRVMEKLTP